MFPGKVRRVLILISVVSAVIGISLLTIAQTPLLGERGDSMIDRRTFVTRVAFGLVYYPPEKGFAYHMWNEVWINDRWVPMDATLALGGIGADHIKLGDSNLSGGSPLADLLSVIQVFGRLELEVLEAE